MPGSRTPASPVTAAALAPVLLGIALVTLGTSLDGLLRGLLQGGGVATVLVGVAVLSAHLRRPKDGDDLWLPSRDEDPS